MKRLCTFLILMAVFRSNKICNKEESKYKVDNNFIFISIEQNIWEISYIFRDKIREHYRKMITL